MSREERRAYQRQMKSFEKGPTLPPAARARAERKAGGRGAQRSATEATGPLSRRYVLRTVLVAAVAGVVLLVALGFRYLMARASSAT